MLDLSNNNVGKEDFSRAYHSGQHRLYLKLTEGATYYDKTHAVRRHTAIAAGFEVGEFHYARPSQNTPKEEADHFLGHLPQLVKGQALRPALDLEDPNIKPGPHVAKWAEEWISIVGQHSHHIVVIYGNTDYLSRCEFPDIVPPLWLASYGRNDGKEHPFIIPHPWSVIAAHQYASKAHVAGIQGEVDISHVYHPHDLDVSVTH